MDTSVIGRRRTTFRGVAAAMVPELADVDDGAWLEVESTVEAALRMRPERLRRQLRLLLGVLDTIARARFGRPLHEVPLPQRARFLEALQHSRILLVRRGIWGLRTLVLMGHYTRTSTAAAIGYRAHVLGWTAQRSESR